MATLTSSKEKILHLAPKSGIYGTLLIVVCFSLAMLTYEDERYDYSIFNHFISELGHTSNSPLFFLFSLGLCIGGPLLTIVLLAVHYHINNRWSNLAMRMGLVTGTACFFVGIFPADTLLMPHLVAALIFFFGSLLTATLFSAAIIFDQAKKIPKWYLAPSLLVVVCGAIFLGLPSEEVTEFLRDRENFDRPVFWINPFFEWLVFFSIVAWMLILSFYLKRVAQIQDTYSNGI